MEFIGLTGFRVLVYRLCSVFGRDLGFSGWALGFRV